MPDCYLCGVHLSKHDARFRRHVQTGESVGSSFGSTGRASRSSFSVRSYSGLRTVCWACAEQLDRRAKESARTGAGVLAVLGGVGAVIGLAMQANGVEPAFILWAPLGILGVIGFVQLLKHAPEPQPDGTPSSAPELAVVPASTPAADPRLASATPATGPLRPAPTSRASPPPPRRP